MARGNTSNRELRAYFEEWLNTFFESGLINCDDRQLVMDRMEESVPKLVENLNKSGRTSVRIRDEVAPLRIILRELRHHNGQTFNFFEIQWLRNKKHEPLQCFVGHRFTDAITKSLRFNLRHCLEPSNIKLIFADMDMNAVGFFDAIVKSIKECDFCFFDNKLTDKKPNVYIEAGIAYALNRPFIFADCRRNEVSMPSDLIHMQTIRYTDYLDLMKKLYFRLPIFLMRTQLRKPLDS